MALQQTHTYKGMEIVDAYHKIVHISGNKNILYVNIGVAKDATASEEGQHIDTIEFTVPGNELKHDDSSQDKNYTKQAYEYLKANPVLDLRTGETYDYTSATDMI